MTYFKLTFSEEEKAKKFIKKHYKKCKDSSISYCFTSTGIGDAVEIGCAKCRVSENITDYESW